MKLNKHNCKSCPLSKSPADCIIPFLKELKDKKLIELFKKILNKNVK
jgi:hypothetical protein